MYAKARRLHVAVTYEYYAISNAEEVCLCIRLTIFDFNPSTEDISGALMTTIQ